MRLSVIITVLLASSSCVLAQTIGFRAEQDAISAGSLAFNSTNYNDNAEGFNVSLYSTTATLANIQSLSFSQDDPQQLISELQALSSSAAFDGSNPTVSNGWADVTIATTFLQGQGWAWSLPRANMNPGLHPVLLITTSPLDSLTVSDFVGIVYSSTPVPALGTNNIGFDTVLSTWDTAILGNLGPVEFAPEETSLHQLTPIPEPRVYAAILGFLALGLVAWRRRKRA